MAAVGPLKRPGRAMVYATASRSAWIRAPQEKLDRRSAMKTAAAIGAGLALSAIDDIAVVGISAAWSQTPLPADDVVPENN